MGKELAVATVTQNDLQTLSILSKNVAAGRLFPGIGSEAAAFTLMALCQAKGLHPITAIERYHIIEGRPSLKAGAIQAEFQKAGGRIFWEVYTAEECRARFVHPDHAPAPGVTITLTLKGLRESGVAMAWDKDAKTLKLKDMYRKYPQRMLRARVVSEGVTMILPGIMAGIYTEEEVLDIVEDEKNGQVIDVEARPAKPPRQAVEPAPTRCEAETMAAWDAWIKRAAKKKNKDFAKDMAESEWLEDQIPKEPLTAEGIEAELAVMLANRGIIRATVDDTDEHRRREIAEAFEKDKPAVIDATGAICEELIAGTLKRMRALLAGGNPEDESQEEPELVGAAEDAGAPSIGEEGY